MTTDADAAGRTDAELVAGVLAGDREAFAAVYDRYADRLHDFCASVLRDRQEAADAVQDTFVLVAERLAQLNDPERLRPWLYAVARSVALRRAKARKRVVLDAEVSDMADPEAGPPRAAEVAALRELVWSAAAGLSERDRALLDLHVRQGLDGAELGEAMGVNTSHAYVLLTRLRDQVERSLGALLIARLGRKDCLELDGMLASWDGKFSPLLRKRVARHVDQCEQCGERRRTMVSPLALLAAVPLVPAPLYLRDQVLDQVELVAYHGPLPAPRRPRLHYAAASAVLLGLLIGVSGVALWVGGTDEPGVPLARDLPVKTTPAQTTTPPNGLTTSEAAPTTTTVPPTTTTTTRPRIVPPPGTTTDITTTTTPPPPRDTTPPQILRASAIPQLIGVRGCPTDTSNVRAIVTDDTGVDSVTLNWSEPQGPPHSDPMVLREGSWTADLGPFAKPTTVDWRVTAMDRAGNPAKEAAGRIEVQNCIE